MLTIDRVLNTIANTERPLIVFDLDSTLFHTGNRQLTILRDWATQQAPHHLPLIASKTPWDFGWFVHGPVDEQLTADEKTALKAYWATRFFGELVAQDDPNPGAATWVRRVHDAGARVYYLTARDMPSMGPATVRQLHRCGLPVLQTRTHLHLKPSNNLNDGVFKRGALREIASLGTVVATFDNEPEHANAFAQAFPDADNVCFGDVRSPNAPPVGPGVLQMASFEDGL